MYIVNFKKIFMKKVVLCMSAKVYSFQDKKREKQSNVSCNQENMQSFKNIEKTFDFNQSSVQKACAKEHFRSTVRSLWMVWLISSIVLYVMAAIFPVFQMSAYVSILTVVGLYLYSIGKQRYQNGYVIPFGIVEKIPNR